MMAGTPITASAKQISKKDQTKPKSSREETQKEMIPSKKRFEETVAEKEQQWQEGYASLNLESQEFNCPKDETEEERNIRLKAKQEQQQREINDESKRYQEYLKSFYEPLLKTYSKYYHLDGTKVVTIARKLTKDYTIDIRKFINTKEYNANYLEARAMMFVSQLSENKLAIPIQSLGYSPSSLSTSNKIETIKPNLILSNGQSYSEFLGKVCDLVGVEKIPALAISFHETGWVKSYLATHNNNFGGLMGMSFSTPEEGIIAYVRTLKSYEKVGLKLGRTSLTDFSCYYVNGNFSTPDYSWVGSVAWFISDITKNKNTYFPKSKKAMEGISYMMPSVEKTFGASEKVYTKTIN